LDGRNPRDISEVKAITDYEIVTECSDFFGGNHVMCLKIDGMYVPAYQVWNRPEYDYILCAEYKTFRGFAEWTKRFL
jgi:hypothetical protein